ncbi:unnamed protein product [Paramecium pentaurelia]|uniref:Transmembrane protein n=1 Tax=Paramecium pentaurelia TaxID=43138 RepID=A0A8S1Y5D8_9CILI|nr:unnamed protein product [Paramecium pentaurelia]
MQQVKYPDLNMLSQETLSQQLFENNNQNIKFIPIVTPNQDQILQQIQAQQQQKSKDVSPYQEYSNYQVTQEQQSISNLIKDQDFQKQKKFLQKILGIFILWTIGACLTYIFFCYTLFRIKRIEVVFLLFILISLFSIPILIKVGIGKNYRNTSSSITILLGLILSYTIFYLGILGLIMFIIHEYWACKYRKLQKPWNQLLCQFYNANILKHGNTSNQNDLQQYIYRFQDVFFAQLVVIFLCGIFVKELSFALVLAIPYPFCVMNVFKQILKGRFNLQDDQVITGSITAFYGLFICCRN